MNKIKAFIRLVLLILLVGIVFISFVSEIASPDMGFLYSAKRFKEKVILQTKLSPSSKADYYNYLVQTRLSEISEMFDTGNLKEGAMYQISLRYSSTVGNYVQFLIDNNLDEQLKQLYKNIPEHQIILEKILNRYPTTLGYEEKWIRDAINYLEVYKKQIADSGKV